MVLNVLHCKVDAVKRDPQLKIVIIFLNGGSDQGSCRFDLIPGQNSYALNNLSFLYWGAAVGHMAVPEPLFGHHLHSKHKHDLRVAVPSIVMESANKLRVVSY